MNIFDTIVIGAGQGGLNASYYLKKAKLNHVVLERGQIGESWHSQRWDSFLLNSPNKINTLAGDTVQNGQGESFWTALEFTKYLKDYASKFQLPVKERCKVVKIDKDLYTGLFRILFIETDRENLYTSRSIIIASGGNSEKKIPPISNKIHNSILQIHAADYRNPGQLPAGAILVIGSAQSGCQIAEDLASAGRKVFLSTSAVARVPRKFRARDIHDWLIDLKFFEVRKEDIKDPAMIHMKAPQLTATRGGDKTISLQSLAKGGITLLGKLSAVSGTELHFKDDLAAHVQFADGFSMQVKQMINDFIAKSKLDVAPEEPDEEDIPAAPSLYQNPETSIDLKQKNITSIIWACGFQGNLDYLHFSVKDEDHQPIQSNGCSEIEGIYFVGFPFLRNRKSSLIYGSKFDAEFIVNRLVQLVSTQDAHQDHRP